MSTEQVLILGAGVTGLQTALTLLQTGKYAVTILATHLPASHRSIDYTSPWAGGIWRSHASSAPADEEAAAWDRESYDYWMELLKQRSEEDVGLGIRTERNYWTDVEDEEVRNGGEKLWWRDVVRGFERIPKEKCPVGNAGVKYDSICINVPRYLNFLVEEVEKHGTKLVEGTVETDDGMGGVLRSAKQILEDNGLHKEAAFTIFVNASGLGARKFVGAEEAQKLFPQRGQTVLVQGECTEGRTLIGVDEDPTNTEISYIIPRPGSGTTIIGGCRQPHNWDAEEDIELTQRILRRNKQLAPELLVDGEFKVISVQVGLRPARLGGPRVQAETVDGLRVVHAYGHAGAGYQNSIGSARKVSNILEGIQ